jgi:pimeloyl-ACP methyl ester carboxylesterase
MFTPGGRFSKDSPGVRELATALAERGNRVLIWDRPNCGASDVCFTGTSESAMQADVLAALLAHLDMAPAVIAGGSGGSLAVPYIGATFDLDGKAIGKVVLDVGPARCKPVTWTKGAAAVNARAPDSAWSRPSM